MKRDGFFRRTLRCWGVMILGAILALIVVISTMSLYENHTILKWIFCIITLIMQLMMLFNHGYGVGHEDLKLTRRGAAINPKKNSLLLSLFIALPLLISLGAVLLAKIGVIPNILWIYQLVNPYFLPFVQIFAPESVIENFSALAMIVNFLLILTIPAGFYFGYVLGFKDVDIKYEVMYRRKNPDKKS